MGSTAVGWGINCKARRSSIQAKIQLSVLPVTASDGGGMGSEGTGPDAAMLDAHHHFAYCITWAPPPPPPAVVLRFGGICTKQNDGSILAYKWDQGKPLLTQTTGAILGEHSFSLHYFCSLCLWYGIADMLPYSPGDIWKDIAWHM